MRDVIPIIMLTPLGKEELIKGVIAEYEAIPLYRVHLDWKYVVGPVTVGLVTTLTIYGIDMLLGNDIAGDKVYTLTKSDQETGKLETVDPDVVPEHAATKA